MTFSQVKKVLSPIWSWTLLTGNFFEVFFKGISKGISRLKSIQHKHSLISPQWYKWHYWYFRTWKIFIELKSYKKQLASTTFKLDFLKTKKMDLGHYWSNSTKWLLIGQPPPLGLSMGSRQYHTLSYRKKFRRWRTSSVKNIRRQNFRHFLKISSFFADEFVLPTRFFIHNLLK